MSFLITALFSGSFLAADDPRPAPTDLKEFSPNHRFFLTSKIKESRTRVFRVSNPSVILWEVPTYIRIPDLSDDGRHIAASYEGGNILENNVRPLDPLITFYNFSGSKRIVTVGEIVGDVSRLRRSTSGLPWGRVLGFGPTGRLIIVLDTGKTLALSPDPN